MAGLTAPITTGWDSSQAANRGGFDQRDRESTMGHLVADMYLSAANSTGRTPADIGIVNPGGLRDEFPGGLRTSLDTAVSDVTVAQALNVTPFANNLWTTTLTGAQLKQVLEEQWQTTADGAQTSRAYLQLGLSSNVSYTFTGARDSSGHATLNNNIDEIFIDGKKVIDDQQITVAIPSFLLGGGDNFRTLSQGMDAKDTALVDSDAFQSYLKGEGTIFATTDPFYKEIAWMQQEGISTGWADGTFRPYDSVSREAMAAFFYRAAGSPQFEAPAVSPFKDVASTSPFYKEIAWMSSAKLSTGWADGKYRPYDEVSREATAAFFYRADQSGVKF